MTKKKLNTEGIANELEGASLFFTKSASSLPEPVPETEKPSVEEGANPLADSPFFEKPTSSLPQAQKEENQYQKRSNERTFERTDERSNERLTERPPKQKREKIRHTFDIYKDQLISLQMIQLEKVQAGKKKPKLGKMVSTGIDLFIKESSKRKRA